eukprot:3266197-Alexandrium_andersonii.AAC.1
MFKADADAQHPEAGCYGPSAPSARNGLLQVPTTADIGIPMILSLALDSPGEARRFHGQGQKHL